MVTEEKAATIEDEATMRSIKMVLTTKEFTIPATIEDKALTAAIDGKPTR